MPPILDLVRDSKLETGFADDGTTVHTFIERDRARGRVYRQESWKRERRLGRGGFGAVHLERCTAGTSPGAVRAVKIIERHSGSSKPIDFNRELEAIAKFSHRRYNLWFVESFGWYEDKESVFISMEFCQHGDLQRYLFQTHSLPVAHAKQISFQVLEGLHQMHENGFAHRDLKPANILIKEMPPENWWVVLADFGITKRAEDNYGPSTAKGTADFMAPELRGFVDVPKSDEGPNFKAGDMWSLGEITFRMLLDEAAFPQPRELIDFCQGKRSYPLNRLPPSAGNDGKDFIGTLMELDPSHRMTTTEALDHSWMESQRTNIEGDLASLNLSSTNLLEPERQDDIPDASARWSAVSHVAIDTPIIQQKTPEPSASPREGPETQISASEPGLQMPPEGPISPEPASPQRGVSPLVKPSFGISLEELYRRDQSPVPIIVLKCIQAVDIYGLDHEGIYRVSGNAAQVRKLKSKLNNDTSSADFRRPEDFHHNVNNPATLLKEFFKDLPDPLLTKERNESWMMAAKIADDRQRRDSLHAIINGLPDPNYATLRALVLHLYRVDEHLDKNRMTPGALAAVFASIVMGLRSISTADAMLQLKAMETILFNALQIFDED